MKTLRSIGILGGMGPEATVILQQRMIAAVAAGDDIDHVPLIVHMNPQVPSRIDWLINQQGPDPGPVLASMSQTLVSAGAEALAMPCNTAHHFAEAIVEAVDVPLLHMIDLAVSQAASIVDQRAKIGILASPATRTVGVFDKPFAEAGFCACYPSDQQALLAAIRQIKAGGATAAARQTLHAAALECREQGAEALMLGCSEFSIIADAANVDLPVVDTLDVLVTEMVRFSGARQRLDSAA